MSNNTPIVIEGARLIDGKSDKPLDNATIVIEGNRITRATPEKIEFPKEARRIEARGKTVLPGLIDNHVHYRGYCGELFLAHGVTSVRDLGNPLDWIQAQRDAAASGKIAGTKDLLHRRRLLREGYSGAPHSRLNSGSRAEDGAGVSSTEKWTT